jgi:phosphatidylglycerol---prolipoprotein diacylglyceryl transferase
MYPLTQIGSFRVSTGGLLLLFSVVIGGWLLDRVARARGGIVLAAQVDRCFYPVIIGAVLGGRLWYGLFNWDLYGRTPGLFWALRVGDLSWAGALVGGLFVGFLWCRWRAFDVATLMDSVALTLPLPQALASVGLLLGGEAFGVPTTLPWGVMLFGASRHPTQLYYAFAALITFALLVWMARQHLRAGMLAAAFLGMHGLTLLLIEPLRADSLVFPGGIRATQVVGLALVLVAVWWVSQQSPRIQRAA